MIFLSYGRSLHVRRNEQNIEQGTKRKERGVKRGKKRGEGGGFLRKSSHLFAFVRAEVARACVCAKKVVTLQAGLWTWVYGCPRTGKIHMHTIVHRQKRN